MSLAETVWRWAGWCNKESKRKEYGDWGEEFKEKNKKVNIEKERRKRRERKRSEQQ
jgi:hypothetical protein